MLNSKESLCCVCGEKLKPNNFIVVKGASICNKCMELITGVHTSIYEYEESFIKDYEKESNNCSGIRDDEVLKPVQIKALLDQYIIGQDRAKKILSVACYNHYKRNMMKDKSIEKSNILLVGPTGSGKTYLVKRLAKILNVPVAMASATTLTEAGYIGDDVESVVKKLLDASDGDVKKAEKGIIFIDEIDKLSGESSETKKNVGGKGVQQALLTLLEGTIVTIDMANGAPMSRGMTANIDTSGILFICGGAFPEVEKIIEKRLAKKTSIGFNGYVEKEVKSENILCNVTTDDLREFGLIPEFLGRLPIIASLESLSVEMLKRILIEPKDSIVSQYTKLFSFDNVELYFEDNALELIAERAMMKGTGARSLRSILEDLFLDLSFEVPSKENIRAIQITRDFVAGEKEPIYYERRTNIAASYK